ncbi:MAG: redoxin domain-containing protein [Pseudomonadota bacterium]
MKFILAVLAFWSTSATAAPIVGAEAPDFTGTTTSGETISLSDFDGQKVILEWTNDGCPYVKKHYNSGNMQSVQKRTTADGVVWISIISSAPGEQGYVTAAEADELTTSRRAAPTHVILDPEGTIGRLYEAKTTPHMFVIDESRVLQYAGAIDSIPTAREDDIARAENYVMAAYKSLKDGKPVVTRQSQPYGCSVKYAS